MKEKNFISWVLFNYVRWELWKSSLTKIKKYKVFREFNFHFVPLRSKRFNEFVIIAKNENGFVIRLNYNLINDNKILKENLMSDEKKEW